MPYPNEHAARLKDPNTAHDEVRRGKGKIQGVKIPESISIIWYIRKVEDGDDVVFAQSLRFPISGWGKKPGKTKSWLKNHKIKYLKFEAAKKKEDQSMSEQTLKEQDIMNKTSEHKKETVPLNAMKFLSGVPVQFVAAKDDDGKEKFQMKANSGGVIKNHWYWGNFIIDMKGIEIGRQDKPALRDHMGNKIVGWTEEIKADKDGIFAQGTYSKTTDDGKEVRALAEEGFPWQASVYIPPLRIERIEEGEEVEVNGHTFAGPGTIFRKSVLREVSFCALGADENTSASMLKERGEDIELDLDVIDIIEKENEMDMKDITVDQLKEERSDIVDQIKTELAEEMKNEDPEKDADKFTQDLESAIKMERERMANIMKKAEELGCSNLAADYLSKGTSFEEARAEMAEAKLKEVQNKAPESPGPDNDSDPKPPEKKELKNASDEELEAQLKTEWDGNAGNCKDQYSKFEFFAAVRKKQIKERK